MYQKGTRLIKRNQLLNRLCSKKKDTKPWSWGEYCKSNNGLHKCTIGTFSDIMCCEYTSTIDEDTDRNLIGSREEAEAFLALMQLRLLRKAWVGEWEPDYEDGTTRIWYIFFYEEKPDVMCNCKSRRPLSFPTEVMTKKFLECFSDLIETAKPLL